MYRPALVSIQLTLKWLPRLFLEANPHLAPRLSMRRASHTISLCTYIGMLRGDLYLYLYLQTADVLSTVPPAFQGSTLNLSEINDHTQNDTLCFYMRSMAYVQWRCIMDAITDMWFPYTHSVVIERNVTFCWKEGSGIQHQPLELHSYCISNLIHDAIPIEYY